MRTLVALARSGLAAVLLHRVRSLAVIATVTALLVPFIAGLAIAEGLGDQAADAARAGADLVVTGVRFGRPAPVPRAAADMLRALPGVERVRTRIVGHVELGAADEPAVLVGLDPDEAVAAVDLVEGRMFAPGADFEVVIGARLSKRLALPVGARIPPFHDSRSGLRVTRVVGVFRSDLPMHDANLMLASVATAASLFDEPEAATRLLVDVREGYGDAVRRSIARLPTLAPGAVEPLQPRIVARDEVEALLASRATRGAGVFALHWVLLFAAAVPLLLVASGAGLRDRRRETGVLKMLGWGTDEVLVRAFTESLVLGVLGASLAILLAACWLGPLEARGLAFVFLPDADVVPGFAVPWRLTPGPVLAGSALCLALVLVGALPASWRAAAAEPLEAMR